MDKDTTRRYGCGRALLSERIQIERKQFFFDLKQNPRGKFLKITEDVGGRPGYHYHSLHRPARLPGYIQKAIEANFDREPLEAARSLTGN